jgi:hypothetical protein
VGAETILLAAGDFVNGVLAEGYKNPYYVPEAQAATITVNDLAQVLGGPL